MGNVLSALSFGLTLGACLGSILAAIDPKLKFYAGDQPHIPMRPLSVDVQIIAQQCLRCLIGPMFFQAFLEIGIYIASPFVCEDAVIPMKSILQKLEQDLEEGARIAASPPWEPPCYNPR